MNRYIKAMEIGLANEIEGINYFDLINQMEESLKFKFGTESELTFLVWFSENFSRSNRKLTAKNIQDYKYYQRLKKGEEVLDQFIGNANGAKVNLSFKYWLDGNASKQYLDYLELKESREAAVDARKKSNISIGIAILALLVSTVFGIYQNLTTPKPPFEVKVIQDYTNTDELEKEVKELKEELSRADLLINLYESED